MSDTTEGLTAHDYQMAVYAQSACNLSGIDFEFARVMDKICTDAQRHGHGTEWKNTHPICRLYAEQIIHLAGGTDGESWRQAYRESEARAKDNGRV